MVNYNLHKSELWHCLLRYLGHHCLSLDLRSLICKVKWGDVCFLPVLNSLISLFSYKKMATKLTGDRMLMFTISQCILTEVFCPHEGHRIKLIILIANIIKCLWSQRFHLVITDQVIIMWSNNELCYQLHK